MAGDADVNSVEPVPMRHSYIGYSGRLRHREGFKYTFQWASNLPYIFYVNMTVWSRLCCLHQARVTRLGFTRTDRGSAMFNKCLNCFRSRERADSELLQKLLKPKRYVFSYVITLCWTFLARHIRAVLFTFLIELYFLVIVYYKNLKKVGSRDTIFLFKIV